MGVSIEYLFISVASITNYVNFGIKRTLQLCESIYLANDDIMGILYKALNLCYTIYFNLGGPKLSKICFKAFVSQNDTD